MMDRAAYNSFCKSLPATTHVVQWGNSDVWKVGDKVFAVCGWGEGDGPAFVFKVTPLSFDILKEQPGLRPAPYMASRGLKWIQCYADPGLSDEDLRAYIRQSYEMVVEKLTKKMRAEIGV